MEALEIKKKRNKWVCFEGLIGFTDVGGKIHYITSLLFI